MGWNYFDLELRFDLVKNVNELSSNIQLVIPGAVLKFLEQYHSYLQTDLLHLLNINPYDVRALYNEEVAELNNLVADLLTNLHKEEVDMFIKEFRTKSGVFLGLFYWMYMEKKYQNRNNHTN